MRRRLITYLRHKHAHHWPIDPDAVKPPPGWKGWPGGKQFAVVLTHDVELSGGHDKCEALMQLERAHGFVSSFNFVPERYRVSPALRDLLEAAGFEVGVHGLNHDGKLFKTRGEFSRRAAKINQYIADWGAVGFRAPAMHHNLDWLRDLNILYDASTFDTDPFEPQPDAVGNIFPFMVEDDGNRSGYVELPYTLPQDFTLYVIMQELNAKIWKEKVAWIAQNGGMVLLNVHPDYVHFGEGRPGSETFPAAIYSDFLKHIATTYKGQYWHALPRDVAAFWKQQAAAPVLDSQTVSAGD